MVDYQHIFVLKFLSGQTLSERCFLGGELTLKKTALFVLISN